MTSSLVGSEMCIRDRELEETTAVNDKVSARAHSLLAPVGTCVFDVMDAAQSLSMSSAVISGGMIARLTEPSAW
eukprot:11474433-Prorocentrum_lima.AAC.1